MKKPPKGLMPEWLWKEFRFKDVTEAIQRYLEAGRVIPDEWLNEYKKLKNELGLESKDVGGLIKQAEKAKQYEKALYALYKMAVDSEADLMIDVLVDALKGYGLAGQFEEMYREGKRLFEEANW